jgi:hypothetical protein
MEKTMMVPFTVDHQTDLVQAALQGNLGAFDQLVQECERTLTVTFTKPGK